MSLELELVRAYRRYLEHLSGKHNQKSHGGEGGGLVTVERKQTGGGFKIPKPSQGAKIPKMFGFTPAEAKKQAEFMTSERMKRRNNTKNKIAKLKNRLKSAPPKVKSDIEKQLKKLQSDDLSDSKQHSEKIKQLYKIYGE